MSRENDTELPLADVPAGLILEPAERDVLLRTMEYTRKGSMRKRNVTRQQWIEDFLARGFTQLKEIQSGRTPLRLRIIAPERVDGRGRPQFYDVQSAIEIAYVRRRHSELHGANRQARVARVAPSATTPEPKPEPVAGTVPESQSSPVAEDTEMAGNDGRIQDFGEVIPGARKHAYAKGDITLEDFDGMTEEVRKKWVRRDVVWPAPDYEKLLGEGHERCALAVVKALRDAFPPAEYAGANAQKSYLGLLNRAKEIGRMKTAGEIKEWMEGAGRRIINVRLWDDSADVAPGDDMVAWRTATWHSSPATKAANKAFNLMRRVFTDFQEILTESGDAERVIALLRLPAKSWLTAKHPFGFLTKNPQWPKGLPMEVGWLIKYDFSINKGTDGKCRVTSQNIRWWQAYKDVVFDDTNSAFATMKAFAKGEIEERKRRLDERGKHVREMAFGGAKTESAAGLVEKDWTEGREITGDDYLERFGFRGGQFGNWLPQKERQGVLNAGYNALCDLAEALDVPPVALSHMGALGISFGARGHGGKNPLAAHFEPLENIINLTRPHGAGCLAHEWAHSFDHALFKAAQSKAGDDKPLLMGEAPNDIGEYKGLLSNKIIFGNARYREVEDADAKLLETISKAMLRTCRRLATPKENVEEAERVARTWAQDAAYRMNFPHDAEGQAKRKEVGDALANKAGDFFALLGTGAPVDDLAAKRVFRDKVEKFIEGRKIERGDMKKLHTAVEKVESCIDWGMRARGREVFVLTDYAKACAELDKLKGEANAPYYRLRHEIFARAFEACIYDRLKACGRASRYLVSRVDGKAYPQGAEREAIKAVLDGALGTWAARMREQKEVLLDAVAVRRAMNAPMTVTETDRPIAEMVLAGKTKNRGRHP
jgi:hypothetical protein